MNNISKVRVNGDTYELKDLAAQNQLSSFLTIENTVINSSIKNEDSTVSGDNAVALGNEAIASGDESQSFGNVTEASGDYSHAIGDHTVASGNSASAEGKGKYTETTGVWDPNLASGEAAHVEGMGNKATGDHSHAEGCENTSSGHASHTEGCTNLAAASYSHVEGIGNAVNSTVDIDGNNETGVAAHIEGGNNQSSASYSHVEGYGNRVNTNARYVHVSGTNNIASYEDNRVVIGDYNENLAGDVLEIGNGYLDESNENNVEVRSNAIRLTKSNNMYINLNDVLFYTTVEGQPKIFSLVNAAIVDDTLNITSTHPIQNKIITEKLNELFQSVSEGKNAIKDALTDLGVEVPAEPTFNELAALIRSINPHYDVESKYLFVRTSKYTTEQDDEYPIPAPIEGVYDGSLVDFLTVEVQG